MSDKLTRIETDAIQFLYGGGDETIECWSARWVVTRYKHECFSVYHKYGCGQIPKGTRTIVEKAKVEGRFGTCYTCNDCLAKATKAIRREDVNDIP